MKGTGIMAAAAALLLAPLARAEPPTSGPSAGHYEIVSHYESAEERDGGFSASASGGDLMVERVVALREGGLELEYDLPRDSTPEERARQWRFPARVLREPGGALSLLNRDELEARLGRWLEAAQWTREICGRWIFTWNAFHIDCDPESVLAVIREIDLRSVELREGAPYRDSAALGPGTLRRIADGPGGARFAAVMPVDPDAFHRASAEADVAAGEMVGRPVTLEAALRQHASEAVSGTIEVVFDSDPEGNARRRTTVTRMEIVGPGGRETRTHTETVERRPIPARDDRP
jgi:hypothetical protein